MESRRLLIALVLSLAVLTAWVRFFAPEPPPPPEQTQGMPGAPQDAAGAATGGMARDEAEPDSARSLAAEDAERDEGDEDIAPRHVADAERTIELRTDLYEVELSNRGGVVVSWKLYWDGVPIGVFPRFEERDVFSLSVDMDDPGLAAEINGALHVVEQRALPDGAERVTFEWSDGRGLSSRKALTFRPLDYLVDIELEVIDRGRVLPARIALGPGFASQDENEGRSNYYYSSQAVWFAGGSTATRRKAGKIKEPFGGTGTLEWAGLEDQYFTALLLPGGGQTRFQIRSVERTPRPVDGQAADEAPDPSLEPIVALSLSEGRGQLFVGPKQYKLMRSLGHGLEHSVWFSSYALLSWITRHIYLGLLWIHDNLVPNYGMAIILATMVLRIALFPVNQYAMVSMKRTQLQMQRLQPKVKAIRNRYKKQKDAQSRAKMNQEMMDLYRVEGVNPMGGVTGCLPMLAQFPILISFYFMLTVAVELKGAPFFGWIQDLAAKDPLYVTPLLMGVTMFAQQKMAMSKIKDPQQLQQQRIMLFMPVMFTIICVQMPSGLVLYWFVNNLLGMGQQWLVNRHTGRLEAVAQKAGPPRKA